MQKGQKIGKAGHFGNCWVLDKNGNRIYNTPACAHIHFSVFQDKEKVPDQEANFSDNIPNGVTDPFGWEPEKDLQPNLKDTDPWENYTFNQNDINKTGNKSNYLWLTRINLAALPMAIDGGEVVLDPNKFFFPPGTYAGNFNVYLSSSPFIKTKLVDKILKSIMPSIKAEARTISGTLINTFLLPFTLTIDFTEAALDNINPDSLSIYSSKDGITWIKELTTIDPLNHIATANINHFSFFALMGEVDDTDAPITEAIFTGDKGQENWYRSDVTAALNAIDAKLGVDYIYYKKQNTDWIRYSSAFTFTDNGNYEIQYYSGDKGGNVEDVKTEKFGIDKIPPVSTANITNGTKGNEDWYISNVSIELTASDEASGVAQINYSIDNGQSYQKYTDVVTIEKEGINKLMYYSEDNAGNKESIQELEIKIDKTPPDTLLYITGTLGSEAWYKTNVQAAFNATDENSGYNTTYYSLDEGDDKKFIEYTEIPPLILSQEEVTKIYYYSIDNAGNKEAARELEIKIDKTPPVVSISASPDSIWPPNGKMINIKITGNSSDSHLKTTTLKVEDEYNQIQSTLTDFGQTIQLEAKRNGDDVDGRSYTIQATAEDLAGNTKQAVTTVTVPHDQNK